MSFSERVGLAPSRPLQRGSMDGRLRNGVWNCIDAMTVRMGTSHAAMAAMHSRSGGPLGAFYERVWLDFFGAAGDQFPEDPGLWLRQWFYAAKWDEVYDLVEFIASPMRGPFADECNSALEKEKAAYRVVGGKVIDLTDEGQLKAIDEALKSAEPFAPVHEQLRTALARLADRPEPDYRNAMKEPISAVETLAGIIACSPGATLDKALKLIGSRKMISLHPGLVEAWGATYGYTSDRVRHGMKDGQSSIELKEALYLVVSCSAFISYLIALANKAGVKVG
jgi:hypothetical protein